MRSLASLWERVNELKQSSRANLKSSVLPYAYAVVVVQGKYRISLPWNDISLMKLILDGYWKPELVALLQNYLEVGDTVIDVGAHVGEVSLVIRDCVGSQGKIVVIEPNSRLHPYLRLNLGYLADDPLGENVVLIREALAHQVGESTLTEPIVRLGEVDLRLPARLFSYLDDCGMYGFSADDLDSHDCVVPVNTLDNVVNNLGLSKLKLIRIDVVGSEHLLLMGARNTMDKLRPIVVVEIYDVKDCWWEYEGFCELYDLYVLDPSGSLDCLSSNPKLGTQLVMMPRSQTKYTRS